jgi:hypothetical protein
LHRSRPPSTARAVEERGQPAEVERACWARHLNKKEKKILVYGEQTDITVTTDERDGRGERDRLRLDTSTSELVFSTGRGGNPPRRNLQG